MIEKVEEQRLGKNAIEFLLWLQNLTAHSRDVHCPKIFRERLAGKRAVIYYAGLSTLHGLQSNIGVFCSVIEYVRSVFVNSDRILLLWNDDGLLEHSLASAEDSKERKMAYYQYECLLKKFDESDSCYRIDDLEAQAWLPYVTAYYGDEGMLWEAAENAGVNTCLQDYRRQNKNVYATMRDWLGDLLDKPVFPMNEGIENSPSSIKVLYYMRPEAILEEGEKAVEKLERLTAMLRVRENLQCYFVESSQLVEISNLLPEALQERYRMTMEILSSCCIMFPAWNFDKSSLANFFDVYYGDDSGLCGYFLQKKKPVIYQSYVKKYLVPDFQGASMAIHFFDGCHVGMYYYFPSVSANGLFRIAHNSLDVEYVSHIPDQKRIVARNDLYYSAAYYKGNIYLLPLLADDIMVYNLDSGEWHALSLECKYSIDSGSRLIYGIQCDNILWGMPDSYGAIVRLDMATEQISYYNDWCPAVQKYITIPSSMHWSNKSILFDGKIWFTATQSPHVICFDIKTEKSKVYKLEVDAQGLAGIDTDGRDFWLTTCRRGAGKLLRWHPNTGVTLEISDVLYDNDADCVAVVHSGSVWIFSHVQDLYVKYDLNTGKMTRREHYLPEALRPGFFGANLSKDEMYIYISPYFGELCVRFDPREEKVDARRCHLDEASQKTYVQDNYGELEIDEGQMGDDNEVMVYLENYRRDNEEMIGAGERIYREIIGLCKL